MINHIFSWIMVLTITLSSFFTIFEEFIYSKSLGLNNSFINYSFFNSSNNMEEKLKIFHDSFMMSPLIGILTLVGIVMGSCYLSELNTKTFTSSFSVELSWIIFPSIILMGIGLPSIDFLYKMEESEKEVSFSFKSFGYQWFWTYEKGVFNQMNESSEEGLMEMYMSPLSLDDTSLSYLSSDVEMKIPNFTSLQNLVTSSDVLHSWALPSIMAKVDAIPGRLNALSFEFDSLQNEKHYGQCSELCGSNHSFMPIVLSSLNHSMS